MGHLQFSLLKSFFFIIQAIINAINFLLIQLFGFHNHILFYQFVILEVLFQPLLLEHSVLYIISVCIRKVLNLLIIFRVLKANHILKPINSSKLSLLFLSLYILARFNGIRIHLEVNYHSKFWVHQIFNLSYLLLIMWDHFLFFESPS